jgi:hypothetical protein
MQNIKSKITNTCNSLIESTEIYNTHKIHAIFMHELIRVSNLTMGFNVIKQFTIHRIVYFK